MMVVNKVQSKVPQLRFPEFSGEWKLTRAYKYCDLISGQHLSPDDYNIDGGGDPYFTGPSDFTEVNSDVTKWTDLDCKKSKLGDVLITVKGSGVGAMTINKLGTVAIGRQLMAIAPTNGMDVEYIYQYFLTKRQYLQSLAMGNMIPGLSRPDILNTRFPIGSDNESEKIAIFLSTVDKKISLLKQKHEQLMQYKKGIMQQLFSQQLRFKDDNGQDFPDWESMKIGGLFSNRSTKFSGEDELLSVTMNNGVKKRSELVGKDNSSDDKSNYKKVLKGDIVYNSMRMWQGASGLSSYDGVVSPAYTVITPNELASGKYFSYYFKHEPIINVFRRNSQGLTSDTWNLKYPQLSSIRIKAPTIKEQIKIESFLIEIDKKINLAQQLIEQTQTYKQGLLQQMFV